MRKFLFFITSLLFTINSFGQIKMDVWDKSPNASKTITGKKTKLPESFESKMPDGSLEIYDKMYTKDVKVMTSDGKKFTVKPIVYKSRNNFGSILKTEKGWIGHWKTKEKSYSMSTSRVSIDSSELNQDMCQTPNPPVVLEKKIGPTKTKDKPAVGRLFDTRTDFYDKNIFINKVATVYLEVDFSLYVQQGSNLQATTDWTNALFANVAQVYSNEGINLELSQIYVWTTASPYNPGSESTAVLLSKFGTNINSGIPTTPTAFFKHLLCTTSGGGIAYFPNGGEYSNGYDYPDQLYTNYVGLNPTKAIAVSTMSSLEFTLTDNLSNFNWPIKVISHELGHNFGSPHTHWCGWKNQSGVYRGRIDSCGSGTNEFNTNPVGTDPNLLCGTTGIRSNLPTIMSYCHLHGKDPASNPGIQNLLTNGFGTLPRFAIRSTLYYSTNIPFSSSSLATVVTNAGTSITPIQFSITGNVTDNGGAFIQERGFCYSTSPNPTRGGSSTIVSGTGSGSFTSTISNLLASTTYYVRSYAVNQSGVGYGNEVTVTTIAPLIPTLTTTTINTITNTSSKSGGSITSTNGANVTSKGVVWSTSPNPTISLTTKTNDGSGSTSYTSNITGLSPSTTYYLRSYATNSAGTGYGNELSFTTLNSATIVLSATPITYYSTYSVQSGATIESDGGAAITARGVCWSTTQNPTTSSSKTSNGTGIGTFTSNVLNLSPNTTYYLRAYATNSNGTVYSSQLTFTTPPTPIVNISQATGITASDFTIPSSWTLNANNRCWNVTTYVSKNPVISETSTDILFSSTVGSTFFGGSLLSGGGNFKISQTTQYLNSGRKLEPGTTYYARTLAVDYGNSDGISNSNFFRSNVITINVPQATIPSCSTLTNTTPYTLTATTAQVTLKGKIISENGNVTERGFVLSSTNSTPTINDTKIIYIHPYSGAVPLDFQQQISSLTPGTSYYVRTYATNEAGTGYGSVINFVTPVFITAPTVINNPITNLTSTSVTLSATCTNNGGKNCIYSWGTGDTDCRGFVYSSTCADPTAVSNTCGTGVNRTNDGLASGVIVGTWTRTLTGLTPGTTYYVRAYAQNINVISNYGYGQLYTFTTPSLSSTAIVGITSPVGTNVNSTTISGNVTSEGASSVTSRGLCYSTTSNPTISSGTVISSGSGLGQFTLTLTGLSASTTYFVRAFATNSQGTSYSQEINFATSAFLQRPNIALTTFTNATSTSVTLNSSVTNTGGAPITERYFCYSNAPMNGICYNKQVATGTDAAFTKNLTGLTPGTTYYVEAYAVNSVGATRSGETNLLIPSTPNITTSTPSNVTSTSATVGGNVTNDGGSSITERGICYGTTSSPTTGGLRSIIGSGLGSFTTSISGLLPATTYYVRSYAINTTGTVYGNQVSFTTTGQGSIATLTTTSPSSITTTTASSGGNITSDGGATVTGRGVVWSTSTSPTISLSTKTNDGGGSGTFISSITGLSPGVLYYIRAYATNSAGTSYGDETSFTTLTTTPTLTTVSATSITQNSALSGGNITSDGGSSVTTRGICWSTGTNPTVALSTKTNDGSGSGTFVSTISNLSAGTTYYVRSYATNSQGTTYGNQISFTTLSATTVPTVTTTVATGITLTGASTGGQVTTDGGSVVLARGVVWSTTSSPTVSLSTKTQDGTGVGTFTSTITGLSAATTYYYRAYATNSNGTSYGAQYTFTTTANIPTLTTISVSGITSISALSGGNITSDGGSSVSARGVVWSTTSNPTIALSTKTTNGTGTGIFTSNITGLSANTTYYVRAYATNSTGTSYGNELTFSTSTITLPVVTTTSPTSVDFTTATTGGNVTSDGNATVTSRGVCYSTSQNPTIASSFTVNGSGTGSFTSNLTGLSSGTTYYVRAYATNSQGTAYGSEYSFVTVPGQSPEISTDLVGNVSTTNAEVSFSIISLGGGTMTVKGICYSTSPNPTTSNSTVAEACAIETPCEVGQYTFTFLNPLSPGTTYYVRAFGTNEYGTSYGQELNFTTSIDFPTLTTLAVSNVTSTTATSGGTITTTGGGTISAKGVCWSTTQFPTINNSFTNNGTGPLAFTSNITGLTPGVTYYVRSYATNQTGTNYGNQISFTTSSVSLPTLSTLSISSITTTSASSGGDISSDGGSPVTSRGVCWSTSQNPTVASNRTIDGSGTGSFNSSITGLSAGTLYYVRAYATTSSGTGYGNQISFTASTSTPTLSTIAISGLTSNSATSGGTIITNGGTTITAKGVVWSTSPNPTISLSTKTNDGSGSNSYSSSITGLVQNTLYYVRSYATNASGTSYGNEIQFTTLSSGAGSCAVTGLVVSRTATPCTGSCATKNLSCPYTFAFNVNPSCTSYTVNVCRYSNTDPNVPPTSGQTPAACAVRNGMTNYVPTASEISAGVITRLMSPSPAQGCVWYSVDVTCNSTTCTGNKTTRSTYFYVSQ